MEMKLALVEVKENVFLETLVTDDIVKELRENNVNVVDQDTTKKKLAFLGTAIIVIGAGVLAGTTGAIGGKIADRIWPDKE